MAACFWLEFKSSLECEIHTDTHKKILGGECIEEVTCRALLLWLQTDKVKNKISLDNAVPRKGKASEMRSDDTYVVVQHMCVWLPYYITYVYY